MTEAVTASATAGSATATTTEAATTAAAINGTTATGGATSVTDWRSALPEDIRANPILAPLKDVAALAKEHINAQGLIGRKGAIIPQAEDAPEKWDAFWGQVGRPEKPDAYELKKPEGWDGYSDEFAGKAREAFHKAGLHPKQAAALHDWWIGETKGTLEAEAKAAKEKGDAVKLEAREKWGSKHDERLSYAQRAMRAFGLSQEQANSLESVVGGFSMLDTLARMGESLREGTIEGRGSGTGISPAEAKAEIGKIQGTMADPKSPYMDKHHPAHQETVDRLTMLHRIALGG